MTQGDQHQHKHIKSLSIILVSECMIFRMYEGWKVSQTDTQSPNGRTLRSPKAKIVHYSNSEIKGQFTPVQLTTEPEQDQPARIMKSRLTTDQKNLIQAHNDSENGLKLGISKSQRKPNSSADLFRPEIQINLF